MRVTQRSFTGGEISTPLYARNDLSKYQNGLKTLKNGFAQQEGAVSNRAGLEFVCETKNSAKKTRLIPFSFNTEQTYIIEAGHNYFRFIKDGAPIINPNTKPSSIISDEKLQDNSYSKSKVILCTELPPIAKPLK